MNGGEREMEEKVEELVMTEEVENSNFLHYLQMDEVTCQEHI